MKHLPFDSVYRQAFEVVEERQGNLTLYPHTAQLPILLRAINLEFYGALPGRIRRVDKRADGFHKLAMKSAASLFSNWLNTSRSDELRLFALPDPDLVYKVSIVQRITEENPRGLCHRFRFYTGEDFSPEVYLSGKRAVFSDHVLQRFSSRVPSRDGDLLFNFIDAFYGSNFLALPVGSGKAFVRFHHNSILAFTYREEADQFFITTCLSANEMNSLGHTMPARVINHHYGPVFHRPAIRHWSPLEAMNRLHQLWSEKAPLRPARLPSKTRWAELAWYLMAGEKKLGHGLGTRLFFTDNVVGPCTIETRPGEPEAYVDEMEIYRKARRDYDWETAFAKCYGEPNAGMETATAFS